MKYLLSSDDHRKGKVTAAPHRDLTQAAPSAVVLPTAEGWSAWASGHEVDAGCFPVSRERAARRLRSSTSRPTPSCSPEDELRQPALPD